MNSRTISRTFRLVAPIVVAALVVLFVFAFGLGAMIGAAERYRGVDFEFNVWDFVAGAAGVAAVDVGIRVWRKACKR